MLKKHLKVKGTDYVNLLKYLDEVVMKVNVEKNYENSKFDFYYNQISDEKWKAILEKVNQFKKKNQLQWKKTEQQCLDCCLNISSKHSGPLSTKRPTPIGMPGRKTF
jgi:hypothetical protein